MKRFGPSSSTNAVSPASLDKAGCAMEKVWDQAAEWAGWVAWRVVDREVRWVVAKAKPVAASSVH